MLCIGFALLFTPLFTASLSSVPPELYPHGSAVLGSFQQVAGAALFIAIMTAQQAKLVASGLASGEALAGGVRAAFLAGAIGAVLAVACTFLVRKPDAPAAATAH